MGRSKPRDLKKGTRWIALYIDPSGKERSAGSWATKEEADTAWQDKEADLRHGRYIDPADERATFRRYVARWFKNHQIEPNTRRSYQYRLDAQLLPKWGDWKMIAITHAAVREWITEMVEAGVTPADIRQRKIVMSAIMSTAFNDDRVIPYNPCYRVKIPKVPKKAMKIITPEQYDVLYDAIFDPEMRLLVWLDIETGLRWSELIELRPCDLNLDPERRILSVNRTAVEVGEELHPKGERYLVRHYGKSDMAQRKMRISPELTDALRDHIALNEVGDNDLIFLWQPESYELLKEKTRQEKLQREIDAAPTGLTKPNEKGRQYLHGTMTAYQAARCRCARCKKAMADYRAERRAQGMDRLQTKGINRKIHKSGHIPGDWFRNNVWSPALKAAKLPHVRPYDMRHSHASWSLAGGADVVWVAERMGHSNTNTTRQYIHALDDVVDDHALDAFSAIRNRKRKVS